MFHAIKKLLSRQKFAPSPANLMIETCPDCETQSGNLHDFLCTKEICPFCHGQLITCDCINRVLNLSDDEQLIFDEYIDDSIPPLSDIMHRWRAALETRGRIPFTAFPDDPFRAAHRGDIPAMRQFLNVGFPPNSENEVGYTVLMAAARGERLDMLRFLLAQGSQATLPDKRGYTALHWAVAQPASDPLRQAACLQTLLDAGANPNAQNEEGITPLMNAAWFGCRDSAQVLLQTGADPFARDARGKTADELASERGHTDVKQLIVSFSNSP